MTSVRMLNNIKRSSVECYFKYFKNRLFVMKNALKHTKTSLTSIYYFLIDDNEICLC